MVLSTQNPQMHSFHPLLVLSWSDLTKLCVFFLKVCQRKTATNTLSFCSSVYSPRKLTWNLRKKQKPSPFQKEKSFSKVRRSLIRSCSTCFAITGNQAAVQLHRLQNGRGLMGPAFQHKWHVQRDMQDFFCGFHAGIQSLRQDPSLGPQSRFDGLVFCCCWADQEKHM